MPGTEAIVLAAGAGRRFGRGKLIADWRGQPLIRWSVAAAHASQTGRVTVILGSDAERVHAVLDPEIATQVCLDWEEGIAASLRCGLSILDPATDAVLIFLGDMPLLSPGLGARLLREVARNAPAAIAEYRGTAAHPVAVHRSVFPLLMELSGDHGARSLLSGLTGVRLIETNDPGSIFDVDTASHERGE